MATRDETRTRTLLSLVATLLIVSLGPGLTGRAAAVAEPQLTLSPAAGPPGATVTATGSGFCAAPCPPVDVDFSGVSVATGVAVAANGSFRASFRVPGGTQGGVNTVSATQQTADGRRALEATARFDITPSTPPPTTPAPRRPTTTPAPTTNRASPTSSTPPTTRARTTTKPTRTTSTTKPDRAKRRERNPTTAPRTSSDDGHGSKLPLVVLIIVAIGGLGALTTILLHRSRSARSPDADTKMATDG
jgi:hypothetical protein